MIASCHTNESGLTHGWGTSHTWMSHGTHTNESCHTYEWVMSRMWLSHVTRMNQSWHTCEWVMSHMWMRHVTHMNEARHTYEWGTWHMWRSAVTHSSRNPMYRSLSGLICFICAIRSYVWLIHMCDTCVTWLIPTYRDCRGQILFVTHMHCNTYTYALQSEIWRGCLLRNLCGCTNIQIYPIYAIIYKYTHSIHKCVNLYYLYIWVSRVESV